MPSARATRRARPAVAARRRGPSTGAVVAVVVLVLFACAVGFGVYRAQRGHVADGAVPAGADPAGVAVGRPDAPVTIDLYVDFQCPACAEYERRSGATLDELVASGRARLVLHPVAYLDRLSSTRYSSRSAAALGCAADAGVMSRFARSVFAQQPPEGGAGLPAERLVALGTAAGAGPEFAPCVHAERYAGWARSVTDAASRAGVTATPTVLVNGREIARTDEALRAAVAAA